MRPSCLELMWLSCDFGEKRRTEKATQRLDITDRSETDGRYQRAVGRCPRGPAGEVAGRAGGITGGGGSRVEVKGTCFCTEGRAFVCPSKHHQSKDILTKL